MSSSKFSVILNQVNIFAEHFFYYFNLLLICFVTYLFTLNSYLFCGDISHGKGSYLLIMHSTLAITSKLLWYLYLFFIITVLFLYNVQKNKAYILFIVYLIYHVSIYGAVHTSLFLITGMIWGDYSWGFPVSIEFRFLSLLFLFCVYFGCSLFVYSLLFNYYLPITLLFFSIAITLFCGFNIVDLTMSNSKTRVLLDLLSIHINRFELHQSDESLHFFLISISGYYISIIFIYFFYLTFLFCYRCIVVLQAFLLSTDSTLYYYYLINHIKPKVSLLLPYYIL
jgi:hypothetical protein